MDTINNYASSHAINLFTYSNSGLSGLPGNTPLFWVFKVYPACFIKQDTLLHTEILAGKKKFNHLTNLSNILAPFRSNNQNTCNGYLILVDRRFAQGEHRT